MNAPERCRKYRRRLLDISQTVPAMHLGGCFSCMEIIDVIMNELMNNNDTLIVSKGHSWLSQAVILEERGLIDLSTYCKPNGLGVHPDLGTPGIACATGSLGHGLGMACGIALANRNHNVYVVLSDGELQEGSTWEAILNISSLGLNNVIAVVDNNDLQSLGRSSETHPTLYPIADKFMDFGWHTRECIGYDSKSIRITVLYRNPKKPLAIVARTTKGYPISFMMDQPIWHYRSPSPEEYQLTIQELEHA